MRRCTQIFLLAGCAFVLVLEAPTTFSALAAGWRGPYWGHVPESSPVDTSRFEKSRSWTEPRRTPSEMTPPYETRLVRRPRGFEELARR